MADGGDGQVLVAREVRDKAVRERVGQAWTAAWDHGDLGPLKTLLGDHYRRHGTRGEPQDLETFLASIRSARAAFPDLTTVIDEMAVDGDRVAVRWHSAGTHTGAFLGVPPTGRTVVVHGATFAHFDGDEVVDEHVTWDPRAMLTELGVISVGQDRSHGVQS